MLNGVVQSVNDANERTRQTLQPYQSLWLAHWKRTDCDAAGETSIPDPSGREELHCMSRKDSLAKGLEASSRSANGLGRIKNRTFETGDDFIKAGRKSVGNERMFSSVFKDGQDADDVQVISPELAQNVECSKAVHNRSGIPSSGCDSVEEDTSDNPPELMRTCSARKNSLFRLNPQSPSRTLPYKFDVEVDKFDKGKAAMSVGSRQRSGDMRMLEHEQCCERKVGSGSPSQLDNSSDECFRESISCGHSLSMINRGWFMEMQKSSGIRLFPSQSNSSEEYETTKSHNDCYSQLKLKNVHGLGTMTICTAVDVSGGTLAGFPRFSQTNNDLLTTKKTDVNTFKENDTLSRRVFTKINGNMSGELHSILPFFGQNNLKVQLQSRSCLNDSEVKEYMRDVKASMVTLRNELSAETDSMRMDSFKDNKHKNLHSASNLTASAKTFNMESTEVVPSREVGHGRLNYKLPDINLKPDAASSSVNTSPSSSRSLSLETEKLVERVKQPKVKYNSSADEFPNTDAGNRWVKRLKLSSSNSYVQGIKSSSFSSSSYHESRSKLFSGSSTPNTETADDKGKALLLSHGWIRRWRRIKSNENSEVMEGIESPKFAVEKIHKGQFPSIAAMALMAKALTCKCSLSFIFRTRNGIPFLHEQEGAFTMVSTRHPLPQLVVSSNPSHHFSPQGMDISSLQCRQMFETASISPFHH